MAVVTITDNGNSVTIVKGSQEYPLNKRSIQPVFNNDSEQAYFFDGSHQVLSINFADITSPSYQDFDEFKTEMVGFFSSLSTSGTGIQRVTGLISTSADASVSAGAQNVSILNDGGTDGTVKGVTFTPGLRVTFEAKEGDTLDAIAYEAAGTTFIISEVR